MRCRQGLRASALLWGFTVVIVLMWAATFVRAAPAHHGYSPCDPAVVQSSGYIDIPGVGGTQKHYFYWLFGPRRWPTDGSQPPVIMWMTGGPGCSSGIALAIELGPCEVNETSGELYRNAYGWNDEAYLLFVDQPTGVGYSYGDKINYVHNESEVAEDMYHFLQGFAKKFKSPSITGANDFYIIGESYAGHYIPAVGYRILQGNQRGDGPHINLKGIGIGNGFTNLYIQYPYYVTYAYDYCMEKIGKPCINASTRDEMLARMPRCLELIHTCNSFPDDTDPSCLAATEYCSAIEGMFGRSGLNAMDITKQSVGDLGYAMNHTIGFFARPDVRRQLGVVDGVEWGVCNGEVTTLFDKDELRSFDYVIPTILSAGIPVMLYVGDLDYSCNWMGNKAWATALEWPGKAGFNAAADIEFHVNGRVAGEERTYGNFSFVRIYDAGHMVPMDQPEVALHIVSRILRNARLAQ
jgi:cathepsin A (carboxypeptidase C)